MTLPQLAYRIVCQLCDEPMPNMMPTGPEAFVWLSVLDAAAMNRVLWGKPEQTGVRNRCTRHATGGEQGVLYRCNGQLVVEP